MTVYTIGFHFLSRGEIRTALIFSNEFRLKCKKTKLRRIKLFVALPTIVHLLKLLHQNNSIFFGTGPPSFLRFYAPVRTLAISSPELANGFGPVGEAPIKKYGVYVNKEYELPSYLWSSYLGFHSTLSSTAALVSSRILFE